MQKWGHAVHLLAKKALQSEPRGLVSQKSSKVDSTCYMLYKGKQN